MQKKPLVIVGIDPGITTGYAVLDINGKPLKLRSSKQLDLKTLISEIHSIGKVLLVGVDKGNNPSLVHRFATKVGARLVSPKNDMKVMEKNLLTRNHEFGNDHEKDSLASALFAYNESKLLLDKIDRFADENRKEGIRDQIKSLVILRGISIRDAVDMLEEPEQEKEIKRIIEGKQYSEDDFLRLYSQFKRLREDFELSRSQNERLKKEIERVKAEKKYIISVAGRNNDNKSERKLEFKENRIRNYGNELNMKEAEINLLRGRAALLSYFLSNMDNNYLLKKLDNLGSKEFDSKNALLNIQRGDILLVDDISVYSEKTLRYLSNKVNVVVYRNRNSKADFPFIMVDGKELNIREEENFALIDKKELDKKTSGYEIFKKVVKDYKRELFV